MQHHWVIQRSVRETVNVSLSMDFLLDLWLAKLSSPTKEERLEALLQIRAAGRRACIDAKLALLDALEDPSEDVRVAAVEVLGTLDRSAPVEALKKALRDDPYWDVRAAAAQVLGELGKRAPIKFLESRLEQERDESVREAIVRALGGQENKNLDEVFEQILCDQGENWLVREAAAWALGQLGEYAPVDTLVAARCDPDEFVRAAVARSLGRSWNEAAQQPLLEMVGEEEDDEAREAAAWALQQMDEETRGIEEYGRIYRFDSSPFEQVALVLAGFVGEYRGWIQQRQLETEEGKALLLYCFYQPSETSFQPAAPEFIADASMVEPLERAIKSHDHVVQMAIQEAFEVRKERPWQELFVVSCAFSPVVEDVWKELPPTRVVISGMACQMVRQSDPCILEQIEDIWMKAVEKPSREGIPLTLSRLKVWHQPMSDNSTQQCAVG